MLVIGFCFTTVNTGLFFATSAESAAFFAFAPVATKAIKAATIIVFFMNSFLFILMFLLYLLSDSFF
ncbi:Uncharacterised protein [Segatella copri]|nr:Uncharacterised protein [Segatella copri]